MILYGLDEELRRESILEVYESLIWTERFNEAGDYQLVLPATFDNAVLLRPGKLVLHEDSDQPMLLETRQAKDGSITSVGHTIAAFFNQRGIGPLPTISDTPANILRIMVIHMQTRWAGRFAIPNLRVEELDVFGAFPPPVYNEKFEKPEPGYDALVRVAKKYNIGFRVRRVWSDSLGMYELVFTVQEPVDHALWVTTPYPGGVTGISEINQIVRFSSKDETLANIGEMYSLVDHVTKVLVHPPDWLTLPGEIAEDWGPWAHPTPMDISPYEFTTEGTNPFDWHFREFDSEDLTPEHMDDVAVEWSWPDWASVPESDKIIILSNLLGTKARDEYDKVKNQQKVTIDGEVPGEIVKYGEDYHLGDLVQVEGDFTGGRHAAQVTEFIRSADASGARTYPTLVVPNDFVDPGTIGGGTG